MATNQPEHMLPTQGQPDEDKVGWFEIDVLVNSYLVDTSCTHDTPF